MRPILPEPSAFPARISLRPHFGQARICNLFLTNFSILTKISIFDRNFDFWQNLDSSTKFRFLDKILIFGHNLDYWTKFLFLTNVSIFPKKILFLHISNFVQNFLSNILTKISMFAHSFWFLSKNRILSRLNIFEFCIRHPLITFSIRNWSRKVNRVRNRHTQLVHVVTMITPRMVTSREPAIP